MNEKSLYEKESFANLLHGKRHFLARARNKAEREARLAELRRSDVYQFNAPRRRRFPRNRIIARRPGLLQIDLLDMRTFSRANKGVKFLLVIIDTFSRYGHVEPLRDKSAGAVNEGMRRALEKLPFTPYKIFSDRGKEFVNRYFRNLTQKADITHYHSHSDAKAGTVERFNRSLRTYISRAMTWGGNKRYLEFLPDILHEYNYSKTHRVLGMTPIQALDPANRLKVLANSHPELNPHTGDVVRQEMAKFSVGDHVRIVNQRSLEQFQQKTGRHTNWSREVFQVAEVDKSRGVRIIYRIADLNGVLLDGAFYSQQLLLTELPMQFETRVRRTRRNPETGQREQLVHRVGWDTSFDQWQPAPPDARDAPPSADYDSEPETVPASANDDAAGAKTSEEATQEADAMPIKEGYQTRQRIRQQEATRQQQQQSTSSNQPPARSPASVVSTSHPTSPANAVQTD